MNDIFHENPVRPLREPDLPLADHIFRLAFGTFNGLADPLQFGGDLTKSAPVGWPTPPPPLGRRRTGDLVGSNFVTHWGSVGYFGPLTVHPDFWDRGVGQKLLPPALALFQAWGCRHTGLYTYSASPKHLALYQKFGFWPRALTAILSKPVRPLETMGRSASIPRQRPRRAPGLVAAAAGLTDAIYGGLDVQREILALQAQDIGDTVLVWDDPGLVGFAAVHVGAGSEAGSGAGFIKFGAARPGPQAAEYFDRLLTACEAYAAAQGAASLIGGVSLARQPAYEQMRPRGFKPEVVGVCMHKPNEPGYHRAEAWVIDDWR